MDGLTLKAVDDDIDALNEAIEAGFRAITLPSDVPPHDKTPFAFALRDGAGRIEGGVTGASVWDWLYVQYLWVAEGHRGQGLGKRLLQAAEQEALARGCQGVWLSTYSFQAQAFYERMGYERFGDLPDFPAGHERLFLRKRLTPMPTLQTG